jgi:hypothetical protein
LFDFILISSFFFIPELRPGQSFDEFQRGANNAFLSQVRIPEPDAQPETVRWPDFARHIEILMKSSQLLPF